MRATRSLFLCGVLAAGLTTGAAGAQEHQWTLAYMSMPGTHYNDLVETLPQRIEAATDGAIKVTANSSLVAGNRLLESVRDGLVEMSMPLTGYYTATDPILVVPFLPGVSESYDALMALNAGEYGAMVRDMYETKYNAIDVMETAFCRQVLFSTVPITTIEEWNGRKLRVNNRGTGLIAGQLGASAISLSAAEIVPALEQGVIEGVVTDTCWAMGAGLNSVIGHASEWTLGTVAPSPVLINKDALDELPAELRATVIAAFDDLAAEFETRWRERNDDVKKKWQEAGVSYHIVTEAENARLLDERVTAPAIEAWRADMERVGQDADAVLATVPGSGE